MSGSSGNEKDSSDRAPAISVIIPSYNEVKDIKGALESLLGQSTALDFEILVVDSSEDGTAELVRRYAPRVRLEYSPTRLSCGEARNRGLAIARGEKTRLISQV